MTDFGVAGTICDELSVMETSVSEDKKSQPFSLFETCVGLVARNLDLVESFCGFPALIGEKIFKAGRETERFMHDVHYMTAALRLFADAFEDELLSSLSVIGNFTFYSSLI